MQDLLKFRCQNCRVQIFEIHVTFGPATIPSILIVADEVQYILTDVSLTQGVIVFHEVSNATIVNLFFDSCIAGYYGDCELFFGHIFLKFTNSGILTVHTKIYHIVSTALEIWLLRGTSFFLVFRDIDTANSLATRWRADIPHRPVLKSASPLYSFRMGSPADLQQQWISGRLPTVYYIMGLNQLASRSFSVISQYPVLPWILGRNLSKPMGSLYSTSTIANRFLNSHEPHSAFSVLLHVNKTPCNLSHEFDQGNCEPFWLTQIPSSWKRLQI
jgi:hypothetical protein